jgi:methyltransferase (TIGR00027 family)
LKTGVAIRRKKYMSASAENIVQRGEPSRSALRVARLRAAHQLLDEPIVFPDPFALSILGKEMEDAVRENPFEFNDGFSRGMRAWLVVRSRRAEDELEHAVQKGVRQYVSLGAGLDTFAFRNPHAAAGLKVYEVDHASTQAWKKSLVTEVGIPLPESLKFVPVNFEKDQLFEELMRAGFSTAQPACFAWLGVTVYLSREAVLDTLKAVASMPKGTSITFDFAILRSMLNPVEKFLNELVSQTFSAQGEPWITFFDPEELRQELKKIGFSETEDVGPPELNARYLYRRKDGLQAGGGSRVMCARV